VSDPHPTFAALILWSLIAATVGYWLCRRRPWLALFWVAGSIYLPVIALVACAEPGAEPARFYRLVTYVTLATGIVFPVLGAVAGGLRFWSTGAAMFSRPPVSEPDPIQSSGSAGSPGQSKVAEHEHGPGDDA
jgi:hypothetical protein